MKRRIRQILAGILVLAAVLAVTGAIWETLARRGAARRFPPPGKMVEVDGRRLQMDCRGSGSPTVVLESGMDHFGSLAWATVHDSLARTTRVCAYSRAGIMWSHAAPGGFDSRRTAADLHVALQRAGERPPWVMVGHSMGGPYVLAFTGRFPAQVAGLVFVDASHPDMRTRMRAAGWTPSFFQRVRDVGINVAGPVLLRLGAARLVPVNNTPPAATPEQRAAHRAYFPTSVAALIEENAAIDASLATAGRHRRLGDRPVVVLTGARRMAPAVRERQGISQEQEAQRRAGWTALHADEATWSTRARHEVLDDAGHYVHVDRPDAVIRAVREVVAAVREPRASAERTRRPPLRDSGHRSPMNVVSSVPSYPRTLVPSYPRTSRPGDIRMTMTEPAADPRYPVGRFQRDVEVTPERRAEWIEQIAQTPARFRAAVEGLSDAQLDTPYRDGGWTVRQLAHHVPDSHMNAYVRFKLGLTEDNPPIKTYEEARWAELPDSRDTPVESSLRMLELLHERWVILLRSLTDEQWTRTILHPDWGSLPLGGMLALYAWHGRHHVAHVTHLRQRNGW